MFIYIKKYVQARLNLCAFSFGRGTHKVAAQSGQSNMFMIILVVAAMAILGSVIVMNYNPNKTKATTMIKSMQAVGGALEMAVLDITCYPMTPNVLFDKTKATAANSYCGVDATATWAGEYLKAQPIDANGNIKITNINSDSVISIGRVATAVNNMNWIYYTQVNSVPNSVLTTAMRICSGAETNANAGNIAAQLQVQPCGYTAGASAGTFYYIVAMTQ